MTTQPFFLVFEGLDATGKSTLARQVAAMTGAELMSTPPAELRPVRPAIDAAYATCGAAAQLFYASTVAFVSERVRSLLTEGRSVVVDRYWVSTLVHDQLRPGAVDLSSVGGALLPADMTVLVETDERERRLRLASRGATPADLQTLAHARELRRWFRDCLDHPVVGRAVVVDSTVHGTDELAAMVLDEVDAMSRARRGAARQECRA